MENSWLCVRWWLYCLILSYRETRRRMGGVSGRPCVGGNARGYSFPALHGVPVSREPFLKPRGSRRLVFLKAVSLFRSEGTSIFFRLLLPSNCYTPRLRNDVGKHRDDSTFSAPLFVPAARSRPSLSLIPLPPHLRLHSLLFHNEQLDQFRLLSYNGHTSERQHNMNDVHKIPA